MAANQVAMYIPDRVCVFRRAGNPTPAFIIREGGSTKAAQRWSDTEDHIILDNSPRKYQLVGAEQRSEGGRAWKVVSTEGDLVDMREDVFLPILLGKGQPPDRGIINADFQWCQCGSQLRLEEVGSDSWKKYQTESAYKAEKDSHVKKRQKRVSASKLVLGRQYNISGFYYDAVYAGRVTDGKCTWFVWVTDEKQQYWSNLLRKEKMIRKAYISRSSIAREAKGMSDISVEVLRETIDDWTAVNHWQHSSTLNSLLVSLQYSKDKGTWLD